MAFSEKPPLLRGTVQEQVNALRDYLFRMAGGLEEAANAPAQANVKAVKRADGSTVYSEGNTAGTDLEAVRKNARELKSLIIKTANNLRDDIADGDAKAIAYADQKTETYDSRYVAQSEYGVLTELIDSTIEYTARNVLESYGYSESIQSMQENIGLIQNYYTQINGEIRRGIVLDPDTNEYVTGIAISQTLHFSGECGPTDSNNPGDGYTYYYLNSGQTFGLYTSSGWQFWIDGRKVGWFSSLDGILHVANIQAEQTLQIGGNWKISASADGRRLSIDYWEG